MVTQSYLDFLFGLYSDGISLPQDQIDLLRQNGRIKEERKPIPKAPKDQQTLSMPSIKTDEESAVDDDIVISLTPNIMSSEDISVFDPQNHVHKKFLSVGSVTSDMWKPESIVYHKEDFVNWIDSFIFHGFQNMIVYEKFELYKKQAYDWLLENDVLSNYVYPEDIAEFKQRELDRCNENSLYALNKYGKVKDAVVSGGWRTYIATPCHEVIIYLDDCTYSLLMGKPRQIAATSTIGLLAAKSIIFNKNFFIKFITEDKDKGLEIYNDKIRASFTAFPEWMVPDVLNWSGTHLRLGNKGERKGKDDGVGSSILVDAPNITAIAGGSPNKALVDEAGNIGIFSKMMHDARPTMFSVNPVTNKITMNRQFIGWGCVCAGTKVWTNDGKLVNIENLKQDEGILGYNGNGISKEPITWMKPPAKKPCYRITTIGNNVLECSEDHPLMWSKNILGGRKTKKKTTFKRAEEVKPGDHLMLIDRVDVFGDKDVWMPRFLGLMIGDGNCSYGGSSSIGACETGIKDYIKNNFNYLIKRSFQTKEGLDYEDYNINGVTENLKNSGIYGLTDQNKRLPKNINEYSKKSLSEIIGGYFDADGNVKVDEKKGVSVILTSVVKELLEEVKFQLTKFGIDSNIIKENRNGNGYGTSDHIYRLYINKHNSVLNFHENINFLCEHKQKALDLIKVLKRRARSKNREYSFEVNPNNGKGSCYPSTIKSLRFEKVKSVEFIGYKDVYNLTAGNTHTYIANNFVTGNTGGDMERGGKSFEFEFMAAVEAWKKRIFGSGIIPIFFDWTTRPGMTQEFYDQQKEEAFSKTGPDAASSKIKFYQQFPATIEDMFLSSQKTLIDIEYIARQEKKIDSLPQPAKEQYGFFEPVYDETKPMPEGFDIPYYIKDVEFIQCDELDPRVTTIIFQHPKKEWADRYYSGTDPIASDSGLSNMAKAIWDAEYNTVSAVTDHRDQNYKYTYMQCMCLGIYYDVNNKKGTKDLLECNIGAAYRDYMEARGRFHCMVHTSELPIQFQTKTGGQIIGIDNKGVRNKLIIDKIFELIQAYGDRIYIRRMWTQLKTFVCQVTEKGGETWGPINRKFYKDDILWAIVYSYICRLCYSHIKPKKTTGESESIGVYYPLYRDKNYKLRRQAVKIKR